MTLSALNKTNNNIIASAIITIDGLIIASALAPDMDEESLASMSAAVISISRNSMENLVNGRLEKVLIISDRGTMLLSPINNDSLLSIITKAGTDFSTLPISELKNAVPENFKAVA